MDKKGLGIVETDELEKKISDWQKRGDTAMTTANMGPAPLPDMRIQDLMDQDEIYGPKTKENLIKTFRKLKINTVTQLLEKTADEFAQMDPLFRRKIYMDALNSMLNDHGWYLKEDPANPEYWLKRNPKDIPLGYLIRAEFKGKSKVRLGIILRGPHIKGYGTAYSFLNNPVRPWEQWNFEKNEIDGLKKLDARYRKHFRKYIEDNTLPKKTYDVSIHLLPKSIVRIKDKSKVLKIVATISDKVYIFENREGQLYLNNAGVAFDAPIENNFKITSTRDQFVIQSFSNQQMVLKVTRIGVEGGQYDLAMMDRANPLGGIDLNPSNLNLQIKRDGQGVPLPLAQQDLAGLSNIEGLDPVILSIQPASQTPLFSHLQTNP